MKIVTPTKALTSGNVKKNIIRNHAEQTLSKKKD